MKKVISIFFALLLAVSFGAIVLSYAPADTAAAATRLNFDGGAPHPRARKASTRRATTHHSSRRRRR
ncbi:MAG: hypothetical protein AUG51_08875 [Acidobacteria bacterium 13_1_20CM_3_53_8]|nr:MAG: hypothetical protein AUG51_08875 [Acidobacteria bacterium 13_1_20CM_3_53_8]